MKSWLVVCVLASLAAPAAAQFDLFSWSYVPGGPGSGGFVSPDAMGLAAGWQDPPGFQGFLATAPVNAKVGVTLDNYFDFDGVCGVSFPVFSLNGSLTTLSACTAFDLHFEFLVLAGSEFGFGLQTTQTGWPGYAGLVDFSFTPLDPFGYWTDLGNGLGGLLGPPVLAGQGLLHAGMPVKLNVTNAAPHVPATLVIGSSALGAPFKGGVMVPMPDTLIPGLLTGAGTLKLAGTWPPGLPAGLQFWMQFWIADPTAPFGLAATNGVLAATP